ncbi:HD superfamily phosphodiesterase [Aurantimicrobium minutum]|uniref:HD domain-containing protein n=1 Tax=Aurantimicrobium minutum TaxID=708131 RepID=UPI002475541C|nr:HD domain-containing protein [Aurantimicrobium minutum]MDH6277247.1 HD superfamily phosphodiesterase [Aurantimicrobium minutum]
MKRVSRSPVNHLGRDVSHKIPVWQNVPGLVAMGERDARIWELATPYLQTRDNDVHTLYSFAIANQLVTRIPEANEHIVLPAIILHDTGWSTVDEQIAFQAIAPDRDGTYTWAVYQHEKEGARIAREILSEVGYAQADIDEICEIIDGHDTRLTSLSINDSCVKDADKIWRVSPHGIDVAMPRFGLDRDESLRINAFRAYDDLFTDAGKAMSLAIIALESMDISIQMKEMQERGRANVTTTDW